MVSADVALKTILQNIRPIGVEEIHLLHAVGRVLADEVIAPINLPSFDNSAMDGFAVRADDLCDTSEHQPVRLQIVGESAAGHPWGGRVSAGSAVRITTGAVIPDGTDTIIPIEDTFQEDDTSVSFESPSRRGSHIRRIGEDIRQGERVCSKGTAITPSQVGILASIGLMRFRVFARPTVAILSTGDELVSPEEVPGLGQLRNSTAYVLAAYANIDQCEAEILSIVSDHKDQLTKSISNALKADIVLVTGGVSVGKYDFVPSVLRELGAEILFSKVNIKPGKPLLCAKLHSSLVFGLPGNPVSTVVSYLQFVRPAINAMSGRPYKEPMRVVARLEDRIRKKDEKRHYIRGILTEEGDEWIVRTTGTQSSGVLSSMAKANCLVIVPEEAKGYEEGDKVEVELLQ